MSRRQGLNSKQLDSMGKPEFVQTSASSFFLHGLLSLLYWIKYIYQVLFSSEYDIWNSLVSSGTLTKIRIYDNALIVLITKKKYQKKRREESR